MHVSVITHIVGTGFFLFAFILLVTYSNELKNFDIFHKIIILLLISCVITVHGISHSVIEKYNYYSIF